MNITSTYKRLQPDRYDAGGFPLLIRRIFSLGELCFFSPIRDEKAELFYILETFLNYSILNGDKVIRFLCTGC